MSDIITIIIAIAFIVLLIWGMIPNHDKCYKTMEKAGHASMNCCGGLVGGDRSTNYLSEGCIGCPYFVELKDKEDKE